MRKLLNPIVLGTGVWLAAAAYPAAQTDFEWTGQLAPGQTIEIIGVNGEIHASAARGGSITVTALKTAGRSNASEVRFETVPHAGGVTVCAIYPSPAGQAANQCQPGGRGRSDRKDNHTRVDFSVPLPPGIGLVARSMRRSIHAGGLSGDTHGTTGNGPV